MKIISFDVGIKNLAYCIIEKKDEDFKNFVIHDWGIINLVCDLENACCFQLKNGTVCGKNSKFINGSGEYYCDTHKRKMTPILMNVCDLKKTKKRVLHNECIYCNEFATHCIEINGNVDNEHYWCDTHLKKKYIDKVMAEHKFKKVVIKNSYRQPLDYLSETLFIELKKKQFENMNIDHVLIENQPVGQLIANQTMKTISVMLYSYFMMMGVVDKKIELVKFVSASGKLKINKKNTEKVLDGEKSQVYKKTKKLGVEYCSRIISEKDKLILDNAGKKKDDLCDSFLQGYRYLYKNFVLDVE